MKNIHTRLLISLLLVLVSSSSALAQDVREFYFGLDLGPKMDIYVHERSSGEYKPNVEVLSDIGATAGIIGGVKINDQYLFEVGLYKNDYKVKMNFVSDQNNLFFKNTLINTITSVGVPISFNMKMKMSRPAHEWYAGVGFMPLLNVKTKQDVPFQSVVEEIQNDQGVVTDKMAYSVSEQELDGDIVTANISLRYNYVLSRQLSFHVLGMVRMGVSGRNQFTTSHSTLNFTGIKNEFYTKGTGFNINVGFRFYLHDDEG